MAKPDTNHNIVPLHALSTEQALAWLAERGQVKAPATELARPTTTDEIAAAQRAVDEAIRARDQECGKVGDNCRKRVTELNESEDVLYRLHSNKSIGDRAAALDAKISAIERELRALGPEPLARTPAPRA